MQRVSGLFCSAKCLKIQPNNAKALYRRGMAYLGNDNLLKAEEDLQKAHTLAGNGKIKIPESLVICKTTFSINRSKYQAAVSTGQIKAKELRTGSKENVHQYVFQINCTLIKIHYTANEKLAAMSFRCNTINCCTHPNE